MTKNRFWIGIIIGVMMGNISWAAKPEMAVSSPNGDFKVQFLVKDSGKLFRKVQYKGKPMLLDSGIEFMVKDGSPLADNFRVLNVQKSTNDSSWRPLYGEQEEIRDHYAQMKITVEDALYRRMVLTFRAYDEGVAERVTFPQQKAFEQLTILAELTQFRFAGDHKAWLTQTAQGAYETRPISKMDVMRKYERPFVMKAADGTYFSILEAGSVDYARTKIGLDSRVPYAVVSRLGGPVRFRTPYSTPWRLVMAAPNPSALLQRSYMLPNLSPLCRVDDVSWIKPGKQMRDMSITKEGSFAIIDLAEKLGLDYLEIDAGWYGDERKMKSDATTVTPSRSRGTFTKKDLLDVISHARSKGLGVILYVNRRALEQQIDELLPLFRKWGVAGIKFGFVNVGPQEWTKWLHDSIAKCAEYEIVVDVHDEYRPTGTERTYPNFLTAEGIRGNEEKPTAKMDLDTAFLRSMCGPADFTMCWHAESLKLSWAHQMAAAMVYYGPLQTLYWYDPASSFSGDEPYLQYFRDLPTTWDQKVVIQGEIGKFITMARRKGNAWFVGSMNAVKQRQIKIPLSFLDPNKKYTATIYSDTDPKGATNSKSLEIKTMPVTSKTVISADMANNGGQAIYIAPAK